MHELSAGVQELCEFVLKEADERIQFRGQFCRRHFLPGEQFINYTAN